MTPADCEARQARRSERHREWFGQPRDEWHKILAHLKDEPEEVMHDLADFICDMQNSHGMYESEVEDCFNQTDNGVIRAALGAALGLDPFYGIHFNKHVAAVRYYNDLAWQRVLGQLQEQEGHDDTEQA